ncbi:hypothetical protein ACFWMV_04930 [Streptomyces mutabilis]|uniref:hypothetical protein n=1 Tax=Streptomyces mutabilis TaxID=67332 RepID=UPI00365820ED
MRRIVTLALGAVALVGLLAGPANAAPAEPAPDSPTTSVVPLGCLLFNMGCPAGWTGSSS